jgi:hypothetical protein
LNFFEIYLNRRPGKSRYPCLFKTFWATAFAGGDNNGQIFKVSTPFASWQHRVFMRLYLSVAAVIATRSSPGARISSR